MMAKSKTLPPYRKIPGCVNSQGTSQQLCLAAWPENSFANVFPNSTAARLSSSSAKALHVADKGARFAQNLEFLKSIPKVLCISVYFETPQVFELSKKRSLPQSCWVFFNLPSIFLTK